MEATPNISEKAFFEKTENSFAIYQLNQSPACHELRFASMADLRRDAEQMRSDVHRLVENMEGMLFSDKDSMETFLRAERFTVLHDSDPGRVTLSNPSGLTATIFITNGNDCCWADGCDTRAVDHAVKKTNYDMVYAAPLHDELAASGDPMVLLENLYCQFNIDRPSDFHGHSLSVSDVIALKIDGVTTCYYTDSFGFEKLPDFLSENPLRSAEMMMEDDYNMLDGVINNGMKQEVSVAPEAMPPQAKPSKHRDSQER